MLGGNLPLVSMYKNPLDGRKYVAEFIATLTLTLAVSVSLQSSLPVGTPVIAALVVGVFVYCIGSLSGAHINPAVTIGLWSIGQLKKERVPGYLVAQFVGASAAIILSMQLVGDMPNLVVEDTVTVCWAEAVGAFVLLFGIGGVVYGKVPPAASGLVIGTSLLIGILLAVAGGTNGVLNPAVGLGIGSLSFHYVLGPVLGGIAGSWVAKYLFG